MELHTLTFRQKNPGICSSLLLCSALQAAQNDCMWWPRHPKEGGRVQSGTHIRAWLCPSSHCQQPAAPHSPGSTPPQALLPGQAGMSQLLQHRPHHRWDTGLDGAIRQSSHRSFLFTWKQNESQKECVYPRICHFAPTICLRRSCVMQRGKRN